MPGRGIISYFCQKSDLFLQAAWRIKKNGLLSGNEMVGIDGVLLRVAGKVWMEGALSIRTERSLGATNTGSIWSGRVRNSVQATQRQRQ